jgi:hypothetical protein
MELFTVVSSSYPEMWAPARQTLLSLCVKSKFKYINVRWEEKKDYVCQGGLFWPVIGRLPAG